MFLVVLCVPLKLSFPSNRHVFLRSLLDLDLYWFHDTCSSFVYLGSILVQVLHWNQCLKMSPTSCSYSTDESSPKSTLLVTGLTTLVTLQEWEALVLSYLAMKNAVTYGSLNTSGRFMVQSNTSFSPTTVWRWMITSFTSGHLELQRMLYLTDLPRYLASNLLYILWCVFFSINWWKACFKYSHTSTINITITLLHVFKYMCCKY